MNSDVIKICGILILCAIASSVLRRLGTSVSLALVTSGVIAASFYCIPKISDAVNSAIDIIRESGAGDTFPYVR